jgi:hypothetical protein
MKTETALPNTKRKFDEIENEKDDKRSIKENSFKEETSGDNEVLFIVNI